MPRRHHRSRRQTYDRENANRVTLNVRLEAAILDVNGDIAPPLKAVDVLERMFRAWQARAAQLKCNSDRHSMVRPVLCDRP
jgi:hypothetical protein